MRIDRFQHRHTLPYPLAQLLTQLHAPDGPMQLVAALAFVEGVARYLAAILIAEAAARRVDKRTLRAWITSNGFGGYLHTIDACLARRNGRDARLMPELEGFAGGRSREFLDALVPFRNDLAHHRTSQTSNRAIALLKELPPRFDELLEDIEFLSRYPVGALRALRNTPDGTCEGQWVTYRGTSLRNAHVSVSDVKGVPSDLVLLLDPEHRRALRLAPFFVVSDDAFCWLDIPRSEEEQRGCYVRPGSADAVPSSVPSGLFDLHGHGAGIGLGAWLDDPAQHPRFFALNLTDASWRHVTASSQPTMPLPVERARAPQPPLGSLAPPPPDPPAARSGPPRSALHRAAIGTAAFAGVALLGWVLLSRATPSSAAPTLPRTSSTDTGPRGPSLRAWLHRWAASATGATFEDPAAHVAYAPEPLERFYVPSPGFHGMSSSNAGFIARRWGERRAFNRIDVRPSTATWEPLTAAQADRRCQSERDGEVLRITLELAEAGPMVVGGSAARRCTRVAGPYLLHVRPTSDGWAICNESWSFERALCASCPTVWPGCRPSIR